MTHDQVLTLIGRLGFSVEEVPVGKVHRSVLLRLLDYACINVMSVNSDSSFQYWFSGYDALAKGLLSQILRFKSRGKVKCENPCFGCNSFEEAMIKMDLAIKEA